MSESYLNTLLKSKLPDSSEIEIHFFELCNLKCQFCGQDHDAKEGIQQILDKVSPVVNFIRNNNKKSHILNLMGGELFNDDLPDQVFNDYLGFARQVASAAKSQDHTIHINWVSNLIFKKRDRVIALLNALKSEEISSKISTSYDFTGRATSLWNREVFADNLLYFKKDIYTVGFVLTRPAINHLLENKDKFFDSLYEHYPLYFDFYVPESSADYLMPSDEDILKYYLFVAKNYPKISPIKDLLTNQQNKMTCYSLNKITLLPTGKEVKCRYLDYKDGDFNHKVDYQSNENIIEGFIEKNQCLSCEWFERCSFRCFVQADWSKRQANSICIFKTFFKQTL